MSNTKPFLKWAGGKTQLIPEISKLIPFSNSDKFNYIEPFVGSGAMLFYVINNYPKLDQIIINDINSDLINTYKHIATSIEEIISLLKTWETEYKSFKENPENKNNYYYSKRDEYNSEPTETLLKSSLLIFLNKTCFNGLYRVNKDNKFNVPIGNYANPTICNEDNLRAVNKSLKKVQILNIDFENTLQFAKYPTLFYMDPPYKPLNKTSHFKSYSTNVFDDKEQLRLKLFCDKLHKFNHQWILSNSDPKNEHLEDEFFDNLYENYLIKRVQAKRAINSKASKRGTLTELLITNGDING